MKKRIVYTQMTKEELKNLKTGAQVRIILETRGKIHLIGKVVNTLIGTVEIEITQLVEPTEFPWYQVGRKINVFDSNVYYV